jgi:hypothetical protein
MASEGDIRQFGNPPEYLLIKNNNITERNGNAGAMRQLISR